jgi:hypothetical protein
MNYHQDALSAQPNWMPSTSHSSISVVSFRYKNTLEVLPSPPDEHSAAAGELESSLVKDGHQLEMDTGTARSTPPIPLIVWIRPADGSPSR